MKKRLVFVSMLIVSMTLAFSAGRKDGTGVMVPTETGPWTGKRLAVAHIAFYDEWCKAVYDEFLKQGKEMGFGEINIQDGNLTAETQQRQIENFIVQKYDMILIDPVSPEGIIRTLDKAAESNIPVIAFDSGTPWKKLVTHIAWDNAEGGRLAARWVADYAKKNLGGKVRLGLLVILDAPHTAIRSIEFKNETERLLGKNNVTYVFEQDFGKTREKASDIVMNNISKPIDVIWTAVDTAAMGARIALRNSGARGTIVVTSGAWGAEPFNLLNNNDEYYKMCVGVSPKNIVKLTLESVKQYFIDGSGINIPKEQNSGLVVIDRTNIAEYMQYVQK